MNFRIDRWSATALRSSLVAVTVAGSLLLASCGGGGGGTNYKPTRMIAFGDEFSVITPVSGGLAIDAKKYSINGFTAASTTVVANTEANCYTNPLWIQSIAFNFGLVFAECNDIPNAVTTAFIRATPGATVADVVNQITNFLNEPIGTLVKSDLVTIMVGTNDVLELYQQVRTSGSTDAAKSAALTAATNRGALLAAQFDRVTRYGSNDKARALYVLIPDVGSTPYAYAEEALTAGSRALLTSLTRAFNDQLRSKITINGRSIGQINIFDTYQNIVNNPKAAADAGILNITDAACVPADILQCTSATLQPATGTAAAATDATWLWAQDVYFGPIGHSLLSSGALSIINNNPF
ncbi:MAG: hypothetical protein B7Y51_08480 [Burkholderiales bacterium 28-67-8]|nr:MAG: hypothetical protein B7Y51_08480 [Burkholderiales bacterium 28-67-8]